MGRVKDTLLDLEMMNELGMELTINDIIEMSETENLTISEIIEELKNEI